MRTLARAVGVAVMMLAAGACAAPPLPSPTQALAHGTLGPFSFDYPASWTLVPAGHPLHYTEVYGFVVAPGATAVETCGPDYIPSGGGCEQQYVVPAGTVVVTFSTFVRPPGLQTAVSSIVEEIASGWAARTVAAQPAAYQAASGDPSSTTRTWEIAAPGQGAITLDDVRAQFGPQSDGLAPAVDALVDSLRLAPPTQ